MNTALMVLIILIQMGISFIIIACKLNKIEDKIDKLAKEKEEEPIDGF